MDGWVSSVCLKLEILDLPVQVIHSTRISSLDCGGVSSGWWKHLWNSIAGLLDCRLLVASNITKCQMRQHVKPGNPSSCKSFEACSNPATSLGLVYLICRLTCSISCRSSEIARQRTPGGDIDKFQWSLHLRCCLKHQHHPHQSLAVCGLMRAVEQCLWSRNELEYDRLRESIKRMLRRDAETATRIGKKGSVWTNSDHPRTVWKLSFSLCEALRCIQGFHVNVNSGSWLKGLKWMDKSMRWDSSNTASEHQIPNRYSPCSKPLWCGIQQSRMYSLFPLKQCFYLLDQ